MSRSKPTKKLGSDFTIGGDQAEWDPLLDTAFFESGHYRALASREDQRCFIVGRTGSGKSAILRRIEHENPGRVIKIRPEDLSLLYIADLGVMRFLSSLDVHLDLLFTALWKHVFIVEIIRHRYKIGSNLEARQNIFTTLIDKLKRDRSKADALSYLTDYEGRFWETADVQVREMTRKLEERIQVETGGKLGVAGVGFNAGTVDGATHTTEEKISQADRFQRIVNDSQVNRLNKMIKVLDDEILDSAQNFTYILVDDLDKDWVDERILNDLIRCLFRVVVDLKDVKNLKVVVALRTNIFEQLNFGSRTGGQEEKYRSFTQRMRWTRNDLEDLLTARAKSAAAKHGLDEIQSIRELLPPVNTTRGNALSYILERTLMRPRDAISYINESFVLAAGKERLTWDSITLAERAYSENRLLALRDEWKPSYPGIEQVFKNFDRASDVIRIDELVKILEEVVLLIASPNFAGTDWMTTMSEHIWSGSNVSDWKVDYYPLIRFLFNIGFIGVRRSGQKPFLFAYDDPQFAERSSNMDDIESFAVHPAFRAALDIKQARSRR